MGYNARRDTVLTTLSALEQTLRRGGVSVLAGGGVGAALDFYQDHQTPPAESGTAHSMGDES
jgi:(S)-ureidoglycine-glyoxylate aminotransferase